MLGMLGRGIVRLRRDRHTPPDTISYKYMASRQELRRFMAKQVDGTLATKYRMSRKIRRKLGKLTTKQLWTGMPAEAKESAMRGVEKLEKVVENF